MKGDFSKEFKKGLKFSVYFYIGITIASLCITPFVFSSSPYLILPFSLLISYPISWLILGIVFVVGSGLVFSVTKSLFQSIKGFVNERKINNTNKNTESERLIESENESKTINRDSGVITLEGDMSNNIENDSVCDQNCFVSETQNKGFTFHLSNMNIIDIAKAQYGWVGTRNKKGDKDLSQGVYFTCCNNSSQLKTQLQEYINSVKQGNYNLIFTSILCINNNHWVTLVIAHDLDNKKFTACYCDSFGCSMPEDIKSVVDTELSQNVGYSTEIKHSEAKQQEDSINCGVFALKNAQIITDKFKEKKPLDESIVQLKYTFNIEELEKMRREFADSIEKNRGIKNKDNIISANEKTNEASRSRNSSGDSGLGDENFREKLPTLVHQTNRENYNYWLQQHDIANIARVVYGYSENLENDVFFCIPGNLDSLNERLKEYKSTVEQKKLKKTFTSIINLNGNHWITLVVMYEPISNEYKAYYCDSLSSMLPNPSDNKCKDIELAEEIKKITTSLLEQATEYKEQENQERAQDVKETANVCRKEKSRLISGTLDSNAISSTLKFHTVNSNVVSAKIKQQNDGHNCGIFALLNAKTITDIISESESFDEIDKKLLESKLDSKQLKEKRKEFSEALMNDEEWKESLKSGQFYDFSSKTKEFTIQHEGCGVAI